MGRAHARRERRPRRLQQHPLRPQEDPRGPRRGRRRREAARTGRLAKDVPGGILSPIAAAPNGLAVFTATDGIVRAVNAQTGKDLWACKCDAPLFAGVAIAGDMVYAADLKGTVYGIGLADGKIRWRLDLPADPILQTPGAVYGSPVVHQGRIYLTTVNVDSPTADQPCAVVCIADQTAIAQEMAAVVVSVNKAAKTVSIPCRIAQRKLPNLKAIYPVEVVATYPSPRGQKSHETIVTFLAKPSDVHKALESLGTSPESPPRAGTPLRPGRRWTSRWPFPDPTDRRRSSPSGRYWWTVEPAGTCPP